MYIFSVQKKKMTNLQIIINVGIYKNFMQMYAIGSSAGCTVHELLLWH